MKICLWLFNTDKINLDNYGYFILVILSEFSSLYDIEFVKLTAPTVLWKTWLKDVRPVIVG